MTNWHYSYDALVLAVNKDVWKASRLTFRNRSSGCQRYHGLPDPDQREGLAEGNDFSGTGNGSNRPDPEQLVPFKELTKPQMTTTPKRFSLDIVKAF